jgi:hypothetical protein
LGNIDCKQFQGNIKGVNLSQTGNFHLDGMEDLGDDKDSPQLLQDNFLFAGPDKVQLKMTLDHFESQFNIPAAGIKLGYLMQRK